MVEPIPARLAILSLLANSDGGMSFGELREQLDWTHGNLESHMKVMGGAGIIGIEKELAGGRALGYLALEPKE